MLPVFVMIINILGGSRNIIVSYPGYCVPKHCRMQTLSTTT